MNKYNLSVFFTKSLQLSDKVKKYGGAGQAADENKISCVRLARSRIIATDTLRIYNIAFPLRQCLR